MSRRESKVGKYIDTLSSGDSNNMISKQNSKEVNNNEVDELSKEFSEMGCVVDAMKRPPNICVETCIYESDGESIKSHNDEEEEGYSDEFEEDKSEEEESVKTVSKTKSDVDQHMNPSSVNLSKSHSSICSNKPPSVSGRSGRSDYGDNVQSETVLSHVTLTGTTASFNRSNFGPQSKSAGVPLRRYLEGNGATYPDSIMLLKITSVSVPQTRRINMSFTNERLREIERHNHILLTKILSARNTKKSSIPAPEQPPKKPVPSAAVARKNHQRQIDHDNMILLKKIQRAKSSALSIRR